jgi:hypothetical protein
MFFLISIFIALPAAAIGGLAVHFKIAGRMNLDQRTGIANRPLDLKYLFTMGAISRDVPREC